MGWRGRDQKDVATLNAAVLVNPSADKVHSFQTHTWVLRGKMTCNFQFCFCSSKLTCSVEEIDVLPHGTFIPE